MVSHAEGQNLEDASDNWHIQNMTSNLNKKVKWHHRKEARLQQEANKSYQCKYPFPYIGVRIKMQNQHYLLQ
jgi:hypothetical protein